MESETKSIPQTIWAGTREELSELLLPAHDPQGGGVAIVSRALRGNLREQLLRIEHPRGGDDGE